MRPRAGPRLRDRLPQVVVTVVLVLVSTLTWLAPGAEGAGPLGQAVRRRGHQNTKLQFRLFNSTVCADEGTHYLRNMRYWMAQDYLRQQYIDVEIDIIKPVVRWNKLKIIINRCREAVSSNTCEYYETWDWSAGICFLMNLEGMVWTPFMANWNPSVRCPLVAGSYRGRNITLDFDALLKTVPMQLEGFVWQVEPQFYNEENHLHICFDMTFDFKRIKLP